MSSKKAKKASNKLVRRPRESFRPRSKRRPTFTDHNQRAPRLLQRIRADYQEEEKYSEQRALDQESHGELDAEEDADSGGAGDSQQDTEVVPPGSPDLIMPTTLFGTKRAMGTAQIQAPSTRRQQRYTTT